MLVRQLAEALGAELGWSVEDFEMSNVSSIEAATESSVVFAENAATLGRARASRARAVLTTAALMESLQPSTNESGQAMLLVAHPRLAFARAAKLLAGSPSASGKVHPSAVIADSAGFSPRVTIGPGAVLGERAVLGAGTIIGAGAILGEDVTLGSACHIYPRVVIYPGVTLGDRVIVHAGAVLGADGFGYVRDPATGAYTQFPQQGTLILEDDVEIGANTTIDRGALGETRIGRGTKIDNLVHLGHNVSIGEDVVIAAQTGISGSSSVGAGAVLAGQVGIGDHAAVGTGVILGGQAGVLPHKELTGPGELFWGTPAKPVKQFLRELVRVSRLGRNK